MRPLACSVPTSQKSTGTSNNYRAPRASERIVLAGLQTHTKIAEPCRREGITATQYYQWRERLINSSGAVFDCKLANLPVEATAAEIELGRMKDVVAETTAENLELKKTP